jgi:hypothetical protein
MQRNPGRELPFGSAAHLPLPPHVERLNALIMVEIKHPFFIRAAITRQPGWASPVPPAAAPAAPLPPYIQPCLASKSSPQSPLAILTMATAGVSLALCGPSAAAAATLLLALARRSFIFILALAPLVFLALKRDTLLRLPRRRVVAAWTLHMVATAVGLGGACCASDSVQCFAGGADNHWALNATVRVLHAVLSRPALWASGLPADALPLPTTDPRAECWLLCMLCSVALTAPTVVYAVTVTATAKPESRELPPGAAAFVSVCLLSGMWLALNTVSTWAF